MWLEPVDTKTLTRDHITVSHDPASDLILGSGLMPFQATLVAGRRLALGCDPASAGSRHDLFGTMRLAMVSPCVRSGDFFA